VHLGAELRAFTGAQAWLRVFRLPAYAPDLNPVEGIWSVLKGGVLANLAVASFAHLVQVIRHGLKKIQYRPGLIEGCLAGTGLTLDQAEQPNRYHELKTFKLPQRCVDVLRDHQARQDETRQAAGSRWQDNDLVFPSRAGTPADASHVRRSFRKVVAAAGLDPHEWTPRELRHSFVSLLSDADVPIEQISRLVGHSSSTTTETIYRKQIRPVIVHGADVMDRIFPGEMHPDA
jgi:integrase